MSSIFVVAWASRAVCWGATVAAVILVAGVAGMLVVAGLIEGFISPQRFSPDVRFAIGTLTGIALCAYFGFAGRAAKADRAS